MKDQPLAGKKILVAEDNTLIAQDVAEMLGRAGAARVVCVSGCAQLAEAIGAEAFDGVVLDARLSDGMAGSAAEILEAHGLPAVVTTGYAAADLPRDLRDRPYLAKPFDPGALIALAALHFKAVVGN